MSSCFGWRMSRSDAAEREPLLPVYNDDTVLQRRLHEKLHSYQMLRALGKGYMPSTEQVIANLRTLLAANILNPDDPDLSDSGRLLVRYLKQGLDQFIQLFQHKNRDDQIQDFIWYLTKARISVDVEDITERATKAKKRADTAAAYRSLQTVGSLLLSNSDFRMFLTDLNIVGREVFRDTAFALSGVAEQAGKKLEPSQDQQQSLKEPGADQGPVLSGDDLGQEVTEVANVVGNGAAKVATEARNSLESKATGDEKDALLYRLKQTVVNLRERKDYSASASTIATLIRRYARVYSQAIEEVVQTTQEDVNENAATDRALKNFYSLVRSFGDSAQWDDLEVKFKQLVSHGAKDPEFEEFINDVSNDIQKILTDPSFFDHAEESLRKLKEKSKQIGTESTLRADADAFLEQLQKTLATVRDDKDVTKLLQTSRKLFDLLSPGASYVNMELWQDSIDVFVPLIIQAIQYIPIPRLEVSTPELDLLVENLIVEPGRTVNHTSFFPYRFRVETRNDFEFRKALLRTTSKIESSVTIKLDGLSVRAEEIGFWLRAHSGLLRLADEGIASFKLDEKGLDIHLDIDICKERMEKMLTLKSVRVHIHTLDYQLRKSKFSFFGWLLRPLLRPVLRKVLEKQMAEGIASALRAANRELLFARERLRATRIADPDDLWTFVKAVATRLTPEDDPDVYTRVGVAQPGKGVFKGVYAPGSVVKVWNEEAAQAAERIEDYEQDGWRNDVFDVNTVPI